jgi:hypothetical protein
MRDSPNAAGEGQDDPVLTPGGPRPRGRVHRVGPGEAVRRGAAGTYAVVPREGPDAEERSPAMDDELVVTPGGYRPRSLVHRVGRDHALRMSGGRLQMVHPSGAVVADFGPPPRRPAGVPLMPGNVARRPRLELEAAAVPGLGEGWIAYASWTNDTGHPVSSFRTTWTVPAAPSHHADQTIFLFNGIQNSTMIYQPVLQWGPSAAGGGSFWSVASWYVDGQGGVAFFTDPVQVNAGANLVGVMTLTGQSGQAFSYSCRFQGIDDTTLTIQDVEELTWCIETLEAYDVDQCLDYPATVTTALRSIEIQTGSTHPALTWSPATPVTDCGQHVRVVSNANPAGEVDISYRAGKAIGAALYSGSKCYFFRGKRYIRVTRGDTGPGTVDAGYPAPISNWGWGSFGATGIDAALYSGSKCYFFKGNQYIRVTRGDTGPGTVDPGYPKPISNWGWGSFGANGIDAALYSGSKCYFFKGNQYIRVTRGETGPGTVDAGYPKPISNWGWGSFGANGIDDALYSGSKCYFFKGTKYIRVTRGDTGPGTVDSGYPASISNWGWPDF